MKLLFSINRLIKPIHIATILSIYGIILRVQTFAGRDLNNDELYQLQDIYNRRYNFLLHNTYGDHTFFPGEYILTYPFVTLFNKHPLAIAFPHFITMLLSFFLLYKICALYLKSRMSVAIVFLTVCLNTNLIYHSLEYRPYAVLPTLALASLFLGHYTVSHYTNLTKTQKCFIAFYFIVATSYHAYGLIITGLPLVYALLRESKGNIKILMNQKYFTYFLVIGIIATLFWLWYAVGHKLYPMTGRFAGQALSDPFAFIPNPLTDAAGFAKAVAGNLIGQSKMYWVLAGLAGLFLFHKDTWKIWLFALFLIIIPLTLILLVDIKVSYWFLQRQFVWVMPFFALLVGMGWDRVIILMKGKFIGPS